MLLPALNSAREKARRISCASNQKQIGLAFQLYVNYPDDVTLPYSLAAGKSSGGLSALTVGGVLTDTKMFVCPSTNTKWWQYEAGKGFGPDFLDYHYIPGLNAGRVTSDSAILFDAAHGSDLVATTDNHDKFGNYLFGDGHVGSNIGTGSDKGNWLGNGTKHGWLKADAIGDAGAVSTVTTSSAFTEAIKTGKAAVNVD